MCKLYATCMLNLDWDWDLKRTSMCFVNKKCMYINFVELEFEGQNHRLLHLSKVLGQNLCFWVIMQTINKK